MKEDAELGQAAQDGSSRPWGIDVTGRRMRFDPWPTDAYGLYRHPTEAERRSTWGISGQACVETVGYFEALGGSVEELSRLLNRHAPSPRFEVDREVLMDGGRWYGNEYWFYVVMFTKKLLGRYDFHYGEDRAEQLSIHHKIYERGHLANPPFDPEKAMVTLRVYHAFMKHYEGTQVEAGLVKAWIDRLASVAGVPDFSDRISTIGNLWVSSEFVSFFYEFFKVVTNRNDLSEIVSESMGSFEYLGLWSVPASILPAVFCRVIKSVVVSHDISIKKNGKGFDVSVRRVRNYPYEQLSIFRKACMDSSNRVLVSTFLYGTMPATRRTMVRRLIDSIDFSADALSFRVERETPIKGLAAFAFAFSGVLLAVAAFWFLRHDPTAQALAVLASILLAAVVLLAFALRRARKRLGEFQKALDEKSSQEERYLMEAKEVSNQLLREKLVLEARVKERTAELLKVNERLLSLDSAKTNFFANVSHELKTPITLLLAPLRALMEGEYGPKVPRDHPVFGMMCGNLSRLLGMVRQMLDMTKLELGGWSERRLIDYGASLASFCGAWAEAFRLKGVAFRLESEPAGTACVMANPEGLETIVYNLLSNALKFTPPGGRVAVSWRAEGDEVLTRVADSGVGMSPRQKQAAFKRFGRIYEKERGSFEGTGLGLSISQEIAKACDGSITVESEEGRGSVFCLRLPVASADADAGPPRALGVSRHPDPGLASSCGAAAGTSADGANRTSHRPSLLLVEDHRELADYLVESLGMDWTIRMAGDGEAALDALDGGFRPDLILSDLMMPRMSGMELLKRTRAATPGNPIPFVLITAWGEASVRKDALDAGATAFIGKPFTLSELRQTLSDCLPGRVRNEGRAEPTSEDRSLSERERAVVSLVFEGLADKEVAARLGLSSRTVSNTLQRIYKKTGVKSRVQLMKVFAS